MADDVPSPEPVDGDPIARIGQRVGARVIDWVLILIVWSAFMIPVAERADDDTVSLPLWASFVGLAFLLVYEAGMVAKRGQTVGKSIVGIEIVALRTGALPNIAQAILRVAPVALIVSIAGRLFPVLLVFLYFTAGFAKDTRGLLDRLAGTAVIVARSRQ